jgi:hypothetical protein
MAKNSIRDYSATNSSNTDIQSIDISEGCSPAGINNAIREVMADLKDVSTGAVALESPSMDSLTVTGDLAVDTNTLYVDSTNNRVGIGTTSPDSESLLDLGSGENSGYTRKLLVTNTGNSRAGLGALSNIFRVFYADDQAVQFGTVSRDGAFTFSEKMRIDSSGSVFVAKTATNFATAGIEIRPVGAIDITRSGGAPLHINRTTNDGDLAVFYKDGSTVGSIGTQGSDLWLGTGDTGLYFQDSADAIIPWNTSTNTTRDNAIDLGSASYRFDDVYATNGTIQTSDANEKQQIAVLTDAEMTAAKAISQLFKTFKWNSAVEAKGDAARTHAGVIAQDVQAAMTAAGLDAGDYAFFISSTWWETQTEVPAVEAVDAVLDEDGNVVTEAVEAVAAYTRTDTYDTAEEAPEGATERTRMGIRYPELLAFVGAATEQRLANIETRLAALEAN